MQRHFWCNIFALIAIFLLIWCFVLRLGIGELFYRIHAGNRVVCTINTTIDGTPYSISSDAVEGGKMANGTVNTATSVETTEDGDVIKCKGGEYGSQPFSITVQTDKMEEPFTLPVTVFAANWWEITRIQLALDLDTGNNTYSCKGMF